jgi:hypothetical protein
VGDHFGWHPATGPAVDARNGHVFVGNLLVANEGFRRPLLNVEQSPPLCGKLTDAPLARVDANLYVRRGEASARPMISWSPAEGPTCTVQLATPADLARLYPGFEARSRAINGYAGAFFVSPELRNYDVAGALPATVTEDPVPEAVRKAAGWQADAARLPGAYPRKPRAASPATR